MKFELPDVSKNVQARFDACREAMQVIAVSFFPELQGLYGNELEERIAMTMYLELIHMGFFKDAK
jgi:hypothetical protein